MSRMKNPATLTLAALLACTGLTAVRAQDAAPEAPAMEAPAMEAPATDAPAMEAPAAEVSPEAVAPSDPNAIVALVGDATVTEREVSMASEAFADELENVPQEQRRSVVVDAVINMKLLAEGAQAAGLDKGPEFEARFEFLRLQAMRNAYVESQIVKKLTDAQLQDAYNTLVVSQHTPEQQVHARHILVDTKEQAEKIIADLKGGASFEELAKQSKDPSGENGGDLGFFGPGQMVPPFEEAALALQPGQITEQPVQSEYGWHVIKVEAKRMSEPPSMAEVEEQLRSYVLRQNFEQVMVGLRDKYKVEIVDPTAMPQEDEEPSFEEDGTEIDEEDLMDDSGSGEEPAVEETQPETQLEGDPEAPAN